MHLRKTGNSGGFLIDLGVVLHGAGAKWIKTAVNTVVQTGKMGKMAHHIQF
ncbi:hypothetical protein SDC9_132744 [bioreactor metagenome]|uniref:Uncharacterized protein n=1 Tax=bioreactor metagenome TaxID=1076179 RepID=A0A645D9Q8_9ZZZZ